MVAQKKTDFQGNNYLQLSTITIYNHLQLPYNRYTINGWAQAFRVTGAFMGLVPLPGPRLVWELVSSWSKDHVTPDDIEGEIARIMAKSMHDAKLEVTPKYNSRAISDFRLKTVSALQCEIIPLCLYRS
jgi:hypothetical protein